jgi:hypothetical protein
LSSAYTKTGYSHRYNVQKARILEALYHYYPNWITNNIIAGYTGQEVHIIESAVSAWFSKHYKYCSRRLVKDFPGKQYEFRLRKFGMKSLLSYKRRIEKGFDLNCNRNYPVKLDKYIVLNKIGNDMSLNEDELPDIREIIIRHE